MMKTCQIFPLLLLLTGLATQAEAGWPEWKFWKANPDGCVDSCTDSACLDDSLTCCEEPGSGCADVAPMTFPGRLFENCSDWIPSFCTEVNLGNCCDSTCVDAGCCDEPGIWSRISTSFGEYRCERLATLIERSRCSEYAFVRKQAVHLIGSRFSCKKYPQVLPALTTAMRDCSGWVRAEAADEIGDQLEKYGCCCDPNLIAQLRCGLDDENAKVRREAAEALRLCGISVPRRNRATDCVDSCVDFLKGCTGYDDSTDAAVSLDDQSSKKVDTKLDESSYNTEEQKRKKSEPKAGQYTPEDQDNTTFVMPNIRQTVRLVLQD